MHMDHYINSSSFRVVVPPWTGISAVYHEMLSVASCFSVCTPCSQLHGNASGDLLALDELAC